MAPTRSTGPVSKARGGWASNWLASEAPIRRTVSGSTLPVCETA
jgi:hypothetical protein